MTQTPTIVDTHAHIYHRGMPLAPGAWHAPTTEATLEQYLTTLDAHGVGFAVLAAASIFGTFNHYAIEACRRHRRLRTTVILSPDCKLATMRELARQGVVGVRFQWRGVGSQPDLGSAEYRRFLRRVAELGWHVQLHDDSARLAAPLAELEASGVNIVIDHLGRPGTPSGTACPGFQALLRSVAKGRTWVKLSAAFRLPSRELAQQVAAVLLREAGPDRLLWGSDWPFTAFESTMDYGQALADLTRLVPDPVARHRIACETPLQLHFS